MGNITVIPAKRQVGNNITQEEKPKLRVAAYCRVSTDSDEQASSYETQISHKFVVTVHNHAQCIAFLRIYFGHGKTDTHS